MGMWNAGLKNAGSDKIWKKVNQQTWQIHIQKSHPMNRPEWTTTF